MRGGFAVAQPTYEHSKSSIIDSRINTGLKVLIAAYIAAGDIFITSLV